MKTNITTYLGYANVPDGYHGQRAIIHLIHDPEENMMLAVYPLGWYRLPYGVKDLPVDRVLVLVPIKH